MLLVFINFGGRGFLSKNCQLRNILCSLCDAKPTASSNQERLPWSLEMSRDLTCGTTWYPFSIEGLDGPRAGWIEFKRIPGIPEPRDKLVAHESQRKQQGNVGVSTDDREVSHTRE